MGWEETDRVERGVTSENLITEKKECAHDLTLNLRLLGRGVIDSSTSESLSTDTTSDTLVCLQVDIRLCT